MYQVAWNDVQQWKMSIISWGLWKGHWAHFVKCLYACKVHNFRVIFKNIRLILDSFWSYKMQGLQSFQGLCPLDLYQGPTLDLLGGLQRPQTPSRKWQWPLVIAYYASDAMWVQCNYTAHGLFSFLPLTGHQLFWKFLLTGQELFPWVFPREHRSHTPNK